MKNRRGRAKRKNYEHTRKKVVRCGFFQRPVFESGTCPEFISKNTSEADETCKNCKFSF